MKATRALAIPLLATGLTMILLYPIVGWSVDGNISPTSKRPALVAATHVLKDHRPLSTRCGKSGRIAYIESDGKRIVVFDRDGNVELVVDPAAKLDLPAYRYSKEKRILTFITFDNVGLLRWGYSTSQFGSIDVEKCDVSYAGQD